MNNICTWIYLDEIGEEGLFPQTGLVSSSQKHQNVYWKCVVVFFISSKRYNKEAKHILYTNATHIPVVEGVISPASLIGWALRSSTFLLIIAHQRIITMPSRINFM